MRLHNVEQGSGDWMMIRCGIPTASEFHKILTPTGKLSAQSEDYGNRLIAERITGKPEEDFGGSKWTDRGKELEPFAVKFYEVQNDVETVAVGFCTNDEGTIGASPDRLVGEDGLLEIKCPAPHTHVEYMTKQEVDKGYWPQIQGQLYVTGRKWVDWMSYHPEMPPVVIRVERDEEYIKKLADCLAAFNTILEEKRKRIISLGYTAPNLNYNRVTGEVYAA